MSRPRSNEKLQEIERVSARLFAHNGYHRTTMRDIARVLQMNQASLYHYFPGKEDILFKLMNDAMDDAMAVLEKICAEERPPDEKLRAVLQFYTRHYAGDQERLILLVNEAGALPEEKRRILVEKERRYVRLFKGLFQELADRNRMKAVPPSIATFAFFGMVHYTIKWYQKDGPMAPNGLAQSFAEILLQGVLQAPERQVCEGAVEQNNMTGISPESP
jgi:TetR/AcrR family transcriptional regulator, cholesterol catabolism regulator